MSRNHRKVSPSLASSYHSSAPQPDHSSAPQPAPQLMICAEPRTLEECSHWLKAIPSETIAQCMPLERLHSTLTILQSRSSRQQRKDVQQLLQSWNIPQKVAGRKRSYDEVKKDLEAEVLAETHRLKKVQDASHSQNLYESATAAGTQFSAIQTALQRRGIQRQCSSWSHK